MKDFKEIINVTLLYLIAILYVVFVFDKIGITLFIILLYSVTLYMQIMSKKRSDKEKEKSLGKIQKKLDESQRESEETYKRFLSLSKTLGSGVFMINDEGIISFSNKDVENYFNKNFNNLDYNELVSIKPLYKFVNKAFLTEQTLRNQIIINEKVYDLTATPIFEEDMFTGSLILVHDITLIKTAEKFQKRFTADVSHELRTPLSAIKGFSEIINRDGELPQEDMKEFTSLIQIEAERMETILKDLTVISKLDRIDYDLDLQNIDIKDLIKETTNVLKQKVKQKELKLEVNAETQVLLVDKTKMSQVFLNIIKNAINYTDTGFIDVLGYVDKDLYIVKITDSGIGIPENKLENIFKRFYRVDKARSRDTGGSGLGLSISKNVILKHGGEISVESVLNKGSVFTIKIPIKK